MIHKKGLRLNRKNKPIIIKHAMSQKVNWAYWAGWADGDGYFKKDSYLLRLVEHEPVEKLAEIFSASVLHLTDEIDYHKKKAQGRGSGVKNIRACVKICGARYEFFIDQVAPYVIDKSNFMYRALKNMNIKKKYSYLEFNKEDFLSWFTGFAEAEGTFYYEPKFNMYNLTIPNTNLTLIHYIQSQLIKLGIDAKIIKIKKEGMYYHATYNQMIHQKEADKLYISGKKVVPLLKQMVPMMLIKKKRDAAINIINHRFKR